MQKIFIGLILFLSIFSLAIADWEPLTNDGAANVDIGPSTYSSIDSGSDSLPVIAFVAAGSSDLVVKKWNGNSWEMVGPAVFSSGIIALNLFIDDQDDIYIAYSDAGSGRCSVKKFNGSVWEFVGPADFTFDITTGIDLYVEESVPYVAFQSGINAIGVMKFNVAATSNWLYVGNPDITSGGGGYVPRIVVDQGVPYISYKDAAQSNSTTVKKYDEVGMSWETLASDGFDGSLGAGSVNLDVYKGDVYVFSVDPNNGNQPTLYKYDGTLDQFDIVAAYPGHEMDSEGCNLEFRNGYGYATFSAYTYMENYAVLYVLKYDGSSFSLLGTGPLNESGDSVQFYDLSISEQEDVYVSFVNYPDGESVHCMQYLDFESAGYGTSILAVTTNLTITGRGVTISADQDGNIDDFTTTIKEINGLVAESLDLDGGNLGMPDNGVFKGLVPGDEYYVLASFYNRGNDVAKDTVDIIITKEEVDPDTWSYKNSFSTQIAPWQLRTVEVTLNPTDAYAYERATINADISLDVASAPNIVSYNAFDGANVDNTFQGTGVYGGVDLLSAAALVLEAEGYDLSIVDRIVTVNAPEGYDGDAVGLSNIVPGAKIKYSIVIENNNSVVAPSIDVKDVIPNNCHLFYYDIMLPGMTPTVEGSILWDWKGAEDNTATSASENAVWFEITVPSNGRVTASYEVTVD